MISAKGIHFCVNQRPILDHVDLEVLPSEVMVVLGPNGAGKTSLLRLLTGEQKCLHGVISINNTPIGELKPDQLARCRAVMPQHSIVNFSYTVGEIIALGALSHDRTSRSEKLIEEVMELTQTKGLRERMIEELSGGERQRVHLARVLVQIWEEKPYARYLFLDEPTSSMDISQQHQVLQIIGQLKQRNIGVFAILHDLNLANQYADKVLLMKGGSIKYFGNAKETMTGEKLSEVFGHPISVLPHPMEEQQVIIAAETNSKHQSYSSFKTA